MGGSSYSYDTRAETLRSAAATGTPLFRHDAAIRTGRSAAVVNEALDPSKPNGAGLLIRESRDSAEHPNSVAIAVLFDVTGSMRRVPQTFVSKMGSLMGLLIKKGYIADPHILFGAIGDAFSDKVPLQVGQFEAGNEMDDALQAIYLEGNGGSQTRESYELGMYYLARHTAIDCFDKRGKKGYAFILGDENPYGVVKASQVKKLIGDDGIQGDIPTADILAELRERYNVVFITPGGTSYFNRADIIARNRDLFGQDLIMLENPDDVCELIATTIAVNEGYDLDGVAADLNDIGADAAAVKRATKALVPYVQSGLAVRGSVSGALAVAGSDSVARL